MIYSKIQRMQGIMRLDAHQGYVFRQRKCGNSPLLVSAER